MQILVTIIALIAATLTADSFVVVPAHVLHDAVAASRTQFASGRARAAAAAAIATCRGGEGGRRGEYMLV